MSIASAQITISDLTDGRTYLLSISDNRNTGGYFSFEPESLSYTPLWDGSDLGKVILTATLTTTSSTSDLMGTSRVREIEWYKDNELIAGANSPTLDLGLPSAVFGDKNVAAYTIKFKILEPEFESDVNFQGVPYGGTFNVTRVKQGAGANYVILLADPSDKFINAEGTQKIRIEPLIFKSGSVIPNDQIEVEVTSGTWYYYDDVTGSWKEIQHDEDKEISQKNFLIVSSDEIYGTESFKYECVIAGSTTVLTATINILDYNDPVVVELLALGSEIFKPDMPNNKTLRCVVRKKQTNGDFRELDKDQADAAYNFLWRNYSKEGTVVWERGYKESNMSATDITFNSSEVVITRGDVDISNSFIVSVQEKPTPVLRYYVMNSGFRSLILW